jgi:hypothetical protein
MAMNRIGQMVREGEISFVHIDRSVFQKTEAEKKATWRAKKNHQRALRKLGVNPEKVFNHKDIPI